MADPSLLPPEMRKRERKERADRDENPAIDFHVPDEEPAEEPNPPSGEASPREKTRPPRTPRSGARVRVSLMPGAGGLSFDAEVSRRRKMVLITLITSLVGGIVVGAGATALVAAREKQITNLKTQVASLQNARDADESKLAGYGALVRILEVAPKMMDAHIDPNPLLTELEQKTIPTVSYKTITLRADTVALEVIAPDYATAARQVKAYHEASDIITNVAAPSYRESDKEAEDTRTEVRFQATLTLKPGALTFK